MKRASLDSDLRSFSGLGLWLGLILGLSSVLACGSERQLGTAAESSDAQEVDATSEQDEGGSVTQESSGADETEESEGSGGPGPDGLVGSCITHDPSALTATGFPRACSPRAGHAGGGFRCCSDDSTQLDGLPLFSQLNNDLSLLGQCVDESINAGLPNGCPVPCNPQAGTTATETTCGAFAICCQTTLLQVRDCIYDVSSTCFRAVSGADTSIVDDCPVEELAPQLVAAGYDAELARCHSNWANTQHDTHQDAGPAAADSACRMLETVGVSFESCVQTLSVANQRGFCLQQSATVQSCPLNFPGTMDACQQMNADLGLSCG